ncbi:hypothetical protein ABE870_11965 [Enterococcus avium]|uniref:hypothetical protein n=1 Tax=Enterococcus avium TaxID=33945 RepID=UPI003D6B00F7
MGEAFMSYHPNRLIREYNDRKMAKWIGFYLSEHSTAMQNEDKKQTSVCYIKPTMSAEAITRTIEDALLHTKRISVQLNEVDQEGHAFEDISGSIAGYDTQSLFIFQENGEISKIQTDMINHVSILNSHKWSAIQ